MKIKDIKNKNKCSICGEEACETIIILENNKKIKISACNPEKQEEVFNKLGIWDE